MQTCMVEKPPYRVPTMEEIRQIPWNGYNAVSTFSGGGGSCLGYRMAGFRVVWANEFVEEAQKTYRLNHPETYLDCRDIREVQPEEIFRQTGLKEVDLFDGSPPCSAFSLCGKREKGWGVTKKYSTGKKQQVDNLFEEYIRILNGLQPKVFIAENVAGLQMGNARKRFEHFMREMEDCGYRVDAKVMNAQWYGVPQERKRLVFMGVRNDLNLRPEYPVPNMYWYTVQDAFEGLKIDEAERLELIERLKGKAHGAVLDLMPVDPKRVIGGDDILGKGHFFNVRRMSFYQPCCAITATRDAAYHPTERRSITIGELKRVSSVPDDFILTGTRGKQWERIGRMAPPLMMKAIADTVRTKILDRAK